MLIKHIRTKGIYNADLKNLTVTIEGRQFQVTAYVPVPNNESVLYLRKSDDFHGFAIMSHEQFFEIQTIDNYKIIKFKLNGEWINVHHSALIQQTHITSH